LLVRTPGVLVEMPDYEALALELASPVGELRALVRGGRRAMTDELVLRGLIPAVRARRKATASGSSMRVEVECEEVVDERAEVSGCAAAETYGAALAHS
jgi:hypothetical protein